jgi:hypothetical protein
LKRISRHIRGNVVAYLALFVALSGTAMASGVLNKKKVNSIITNRAPGLSVARAKSADDAKNAEELGGLAPGGYQGFCKPGAIKATLVIDPTGFATSTTMQNVSGFNCFEPGNTTSSVQMRRNSTGVYEVRFVGNKGPDASGSVVCSGAGIQVTVNCSTLTGGDDGFPGETVFLVATRDSGGVLQNNITFSLVAF